MENKATSEPIGLRRTGILGKEELLECPGVPSAERLKAGPVVVIECNEEIPCNPCETLCDRKAIHIGTPITNRPVLDDSRCGGCGLCLAPCPGLAIFLVDITPEDCELISVPHEFLPLPQPGETVDGLARNGQGIVEAEVVRVENPAHNDRTPIVTMRVPNGYAMRVRSLKLRRK